MLQLTFPQESRRSRFSFRFQSETFYLWKSTNLNSQWFFVLRHNAPSQKFRKNAIFFDLTCCSNWLFSATTRLISSCKISIENFTPLGEDLIEKSLDIDHCVKIMIVQTFQEVVIKIIWSRLSKWCFSITASLIARKVSLKNTRLSYIMII